MLIFIGIHQNQKMYYFFNSCITHMQYVKKNSLNFFFGIKFNIVPDEKKF
jgi:hypothetical protein